MNASGPHARLLAAVHEAMDKLQADYSNVSTDKWHDNDAMQIFESLFIATEDIEKQKVNADAAPDLLAACMALPLDCEFEDAADFKDKSGTFMHAMELARTAIAKAEVK